MKDPLKIYNNPKLYEIAKEITLSAGFPYTDPRTLETTQPRKKPMKNNKLPKFILLDQVHVDISIPALTPEKERKAIMKVIQSKKFDKAILDIIMVMLPKQKPPIKVAITR